MVTLNFPCTVQQFGDLCQTVQENSQNEGVTLFTTVPGVGSDPSSGYPSSAQGRISTNDIDLLYVFTGATLTVTVTKAKSFLARHASDKTIASHLTELFNKFLVK